MSAWLLLEDLFDCGLSLSKNKENLFTCTYKYQEKNIPSQNIEEQVGLSWWVISIRK